MNKRKNCGVGTGSARLGTIAIGGLLGTTFLCGTAAPAFAVADDNDTLDVSGLQRVSDDSMDDLRGGFNVGGYEISFGITVTTTVNGQQLLQTSFNVNQPGQINNVVTQYIQQQQAALAAAAGSGSSGGSGNGGNIQVNVEIDEDGDIDVDVDSDVNVDDDEAPELAQALDNFKDAMRDLEKGGLPAAGQSGSSGSSGSQVATTSNSTSGELSATQTNQPTVSGAASAGGTAPEIPSTEAIVANATPPTASAGATAPGVPSGDVIVASVTPPAASGEGSAGGSGPTFQQTAMVPVSVTEPPAPAGGSASSGDTQNRSQTTGGQAQAVPSSSSGSSGETGWTVTELANSGGWSVSSKDLATTITQVIGDGVTTNIVNSANGIEIVHSTEMNLFLENFQEMQANAITSQALGNLMLDMANQAAGSN